VQAVRSQFTNPANLVASPKFRLPALVLDESRKSAPRMGKLKKQSSIPQEVGGAEGIRTVGTD
jgi:hypothetical protein